MDYRPIVEEQLATDYWHQYLREWVNLKFPDHMILTCYQCLQKRTAKSMMVQRFNNKTCFICEKGTGCRREIQGQET